MALLEYILVAFVVPIVSSKSFGGHPKRLPIESSIYNIPNDTQTCVNDLTAWCEGMKNPPVGGGMSVVSITIADQTGYFRALCTLDSDGTNCTKNGSPWFSCSNRTEFVYKGNVLVKDSVEGADNETCKTAGYAFNDLSVQYLSFDDSSLEEDMEKGMDTFFEQMKTMQKQIDAIQRKLFGWFGGDFPSQI